MHRTSLALATLLAITAGGCGDGGQASLVGTWTLRADDGSLRYTMVFRADGTVQIDESQGPPAEQEHITGTYSTQSQVLTVEGTDRRDGAHVRLSATYYANATQFMFALLPQGAHNGIVGTWTGSARNERTFPDGSRKLDGARLTYELRADGTFRVTQVRASDNASQSYQGTYTTEGPGKYVLTFQVSGVTAHVHAVLLDDAALGGPALERS